MEVSLKKEDRELLKSAIDKVDSLQNFKFPKPEKVESPPTKAKKEDVHTGEHTIEEALDCPGCYPKIAKKVIQKELKDADHECVNCGLPVKGEVSASEEWGCLNCGGKSAQER